MILEFLGEKLNIPSRYVYCDNVKISNRTKHVDTRTHFVRHYIEDGTIKIKFVRLEDNDADIFTKNKTASTYEKHTSKFMIVNSAE